MLNKLILRAWLKGQNLLTRDEGIETIEWVAIGATLAVLIGLIMTVFSSQGQQLGQTIFDGIMKWAKSIGGG